MSQRYLPIYIGFGKPSLISTPGDRSLGWEAFFLSPTPRSKRIAGSRESILPANANVSYGFSKSSIKNGSRLTLSAKKRRIHLLKGRHRHPHIPHPVVEDVKHPLENR